MFLYSVIMAFFIKEQVSLAFWNVIAWDINKFWVLISPQISSVWSSTNSTGPWQSKLMLLHDWYEPVIVQADAERVFTSYWESWLLKIWIFVTSPSYSDFLSSKPSLSSDFDQCLPQRFNGQIYPNRQWAQHVLANRLFYSAIAINEATRILQLGRTVEVKTVSQRLDETQRRHARIFRILFWWFYL